MTTQEIKRLAAILREELKQELDELMSAKQAAEYLGISPAALRKRCSDGRCPTIRRAAACTFQGVSLTPII